jgi:hypothetical protein
MLLTFTLSFTKRDQVEVIDSGTRNKTRRLIIWDNEGEQSKRIKGNRSRDKEEAHVDKIYERK